MKYAFFNQNYQKTDIFAQNYTMLNNSVTQFHFVDFESGGPN